MYTANFLEFSIFLCIVIVSLVSSSTDEVKEDEPEDKLISNIYKRVRAGGASRRGSWSESPETGGLTRAGERRRRYRDQYNYYNIRPPTRQQQYQPYNPYTIYDDSEDLDQDYQPQPMPQPMPQPRPPYNNPYPYQPYYQPNYPPTYPPTTTTTTTTTTSRPPTSPIGYMLIDTYNSKFGSYSRPTAFFMNA